MIYIYHSRDALELAEAQKHQFHAKKVGETVPKYRHPGIKST